MKQWFSNFLDSGKHRHLVFRINILKILCIGAFSVIGISLYQAQIINSGVYETFRTRTRTANFRENVPRGTISDRNGVMLVDNEAVLTITYQPRGGVTREEMREVAWELSDLILVDDNLRERDLQDLFILEFPEEARALMTDEEAAELSDRDFYLLKLSRITDEHIDQLSQRQRDAHVLFINMSRGSNLAANIVKNGVTLEEFSIVAEQLHRLNAPGRRGSIGLGTDWVRTPQPTDEDFLHMFGTVTSYEQGIPAERSDYLEAMGYEANDRVGRSQLELQYQSLLAGIPVQYFIDGTTTTQMVEGRPGMHLSLTLDFELQQILSDIVESYLLDAIINGGTTTNFLRETYIVMTNPQTGEILAMVGRIAEQDENGAWILVNNDMGTLQRSFTVGSTVKGATYLAGVEAGVNHQWTTRHDAPMYIGATRHRRASWRPGGMGTINAVDALSWSSNVFFWRQTMEMAGIPNFRNGNPLGPHENWVQQWEFYRDFFAGFGLGSRTGIDLPSDPLGARIPMNDWNSGNLLDFVIGQADDFTAMQLVQYASTLAANGNRFALQLVRDVFLPATDQEERQLIQGFEPRLLNTVDLPQQYFDIVHRGFRNTITSATRGTGFGTFNGEDLQIAGKTGTAQVSARNDDGWIRDNRGDLIPVHSRTFVGYAPYRDPEVALAIIVPQNQLPPPASGNEISLQISRAAFEAYFELKANRAH